MAMRTKHRIDYRFIALFMAVVMFLTSISFASSLIPIVAAASSNINLENALHFYIRHWHSFIDDEALYQGDSNDGDKDRYFVLVEGYINPIKDDNGNTSYEFYMVNQDSNAGSSADNPKYFKYGDGNGENELNFTLSPYIESLDETTGTIALSKRPLMDGNDALEKYAGLAISTGRRAITETNDGTIEITYDPYIHLVKGHAFYTSWQMIVDGAAATTVDGDNEKLEHMFDDETDTASVYTYIDNITDSEGNSHQAGELVMSKSDQNEVCVSKDDLPEGVNEEDVQLSKFYSTLEGLHTDNTIKSVGDGRTFISNLEAWYVEGHAPEVGMVLDASGSMVVPVDDPTPIHLDETEIKTLGITQLTTNSGSWDTYFLDDETLDKILNPRNSDNSMVGVSGYNYFVSNKDGYAPLGYWEGSVQPVAQLTFTNDSSGNTPRIPDKSGVLRSWLYDSITGTHASRVNPQVSLSNLSGSYEFKEVEVEDWPKGDLKFSGSNGLQLAHSSNHSGVLLDKTPSGGNFTLTFELIINATGSGQIEALYIGSMNSESSNGYFRLYYNTATKKLYGSQTSSDDGTLTTNSTIANVAATKKIVTLVFENADTGNGTVTTYINGEESGTGVLNTPITEPNIIIAGVEGNYSGGNGDDLDIDTFMLYDLALSSNQVKEIRPTNTIPTIAKREDRRTLASINRKSIPIYGDWSYSAELSHTQAGWYFITHAGQYDTHYNEIGTGKRMYGVSGGSNNNVTFTDTLSYPPNTKISNDTGYSYKSTQDEPTKFYVDGDGYLRCFYQSSSSNINNESTACSYVYELADSQYVRTEVLRRAIGMFATDLNAESPAAKVSAVRFSTGYIKHGYYDSRNNLVFKDASGKWVQNNGSDAVGNVSQFTDELPKLLLQDWTNDTIESTAFLSMNYGQDSINEGNTNHEIGGARAYTYSTAHHLPQYNYGLTGSTATWSGIQSYINTLEEYADQDSPKYLIIFTDGKDTCIGDNSKVYIKLGKDAEEETVKASEASGKLTDYLKGEGYTIFTVLLDGDNMRGTKDFDEAKNFLTGLSGPGKIAGESDENYKKRKAKGTYFFSLNENVDERKDMLAQDNYGDGATYSDLTDEQKATVDAQFKANYTATDILTEIFTDELLGEMTSALEGYTVKSYIDPRFDLQASDGTVWHLNAGGQIVKGDGSGTNGKITVNSTSKTKFKLTGDMNANAKEPYLRYDTKEDMYYLEWVKQTIPTSAIGANRLAIWNALYTLKAKDDFIGGNAILTNGNKASMNWVYHPGDLSLDDAADVADNPSAAETHPFGYDASSGTNDAKKEYEKDEHGNETGVVTDGYPSKGFPRVTANVKLLDIITNDHNDKIFLGEAISPRQLLTQIEDEYITDSYYLDYIKRYAYQRYLNTEDPKAKKEMEMPLLDLLTKWLEIDNEGVHQKEFSLPYSYLPKVYYDDNGKVVKNGESYYNNTGTALHKKDVLGILTYRWEQLNPEPDDPMDPITDFVKSDTDRVVYSLTVEYTPFKVGDTLDILNSAVNVVSESPKNEIAIASIVGEDSDIKTRAITNDGNLIFAKYIPIVSKKDSEGNYVYKLDFTEDFGFDREMYLNGDPDNDESFSLIKETQIVPNPDDPDKTIKAPVYQWNKDYKPAVPDVEQLIYPKEETEDTPENPEVKIPEDGSSGDYGDATFLNNGRTLTAFSKETLDVASGGIALELKMLIGELEELYENLSKARTDEDKYKFTFTLDGKRSFTDTAIVEKIKQEKKKNGEIWNDFDENFTITFELDFDYDDDDFDKFRAEADDDGYVSIYAVSTSIVTEFNNEAWISPELPIGEYEFSLDDINNKLIDTLKEYIHFGTVKDAQDESFKTDYFDDDVLNGLHTKYSGTDGNDNPYWGDTEYKDENRNTVTDYYDSAEINDKNIGDYKATATTESETDTVTFYIGVNESSASSSINARLGMLVLSTGNTLLTVKEIGGKSTESFLYQITGTTLGYIEIEPLIVSVQGSDGIGATVELPPGKYVVTEISDWSWKYDNIATYGDPGQVWTLYPDNLKQADTSLRYHPEELQHKTVTYEHDRNNKVWLGGEDHHNNHFSFLDTETE